MVDATHPAVRIYALRIIPLPCSSSVKVGQTDVDAFSTIFVKDTLLPSPLGSKKLEDDIKKLFVSLDLGVKPHLFRRITCF